MAPSSERQEPPRPLDRLVARAKAVLAFERLWPILVVAAGLGAAFVAVSWLGLWVITPLAVRIAGLVLFAGVLLGSIGYFLSRLRLPNRTDALARLDRDTGLPHRPLSTADDALANAGTDPTTRALWDLHRKRLQATIAQARLAPPSPRMVERDAYALRAAVVLVLVAAAFVAGPEKAGRLAAAFAWSEPETPVGMRIDAWIDPPGYTGKPPLVLLGATAQPSTDPAPISAPVGSVVVVRASGGTDALEVVADDGLKPLPAKAGAAPNATGTDRRFTLNADGHLRIGPAGARHFALKAVPDLPPRMAMVGAPKPNLHGSLALGYKIEDDYGVTGAEAHFSDPIVRGRPVTGRALVEPPRGVLSLPSMPGGLGEGKTTLDLSDHPWAGASVTMTLSARDEGGNVGESSPVKLVLPAKPFNNPLARALVEQRRNLVLAPDDHGAVGVALEALQIAPDDFDVPPAVYLGLHSAQVRLAAAKTDADLLGVADLLWDMALRLENGDLDKTEQDLRAAQKALQEALERGAPPDEIKRLTQALREQMGKYLAEMMRKQESNREQAENSPQDRKGQTITEQDLKALMDRMEEAAKNGDTAEAQRLLDQLKSIMENLKTAKRGSPQSQATREMNRSMGDLDKMLREQGDVRDQTFQQDQGGQDDQAGSNPDGSEDQAGAGQDPGAGQSGESNQRPGSRQGRKGQAKPGFDALQGRQQALQQQLDQLQRKLRGLGLKGEQGLADAQEAMKDAEGALGRGDGSSAVEAQGRALQGMKKGSGGLQQQMAESGGQQGQQAQGQGGEQDGEDMQQGEDLDPLGRPRQGRGSSESRDLDVSGGLAARAQQVLRELRRRLADPTRSQDEQDYLERLLKRY